MTDYRYPVSIEPLGELLDAPLMQREMLQAQANMLKSKTPEEVIRHRKIPGGKLAPFIEHSWVNRQLNLIFGWQWSFEVIREQIGKDQLWVLGKLTIHAQPHDIVKEQFGRSEIKKFGERHPQAGTIIDIGNDLKAATSDSLKKCASLLGIAGDVYGQKEVVETMQDYF